MLPAYPWQTRPNDEPLTADEVCEALVVSEGDVRLAAERLKVGSLVLRKFIERSSRARAVVREMGSRLIDEAQTILIEALRDPDARRRDWAIRYILNSKNARDRGWSSTDGASDASRVQTPLINIAPINVTWADGTRIGPPQPPPLTIDVTPVRSGGGEVDDA